MKEQQRILFVCTGNLCRSPLAAAMLTAAVAKRDDAVPSLVASAGTHARNGVECPAPLLAVAATYGLDLHEHRSRRLTAQDYTNFDLLVALDLGHLDHLNFMRPAGARAQQMLLLSGVDEAGVIEVPDPYGGSDRDYARAATLIEIGVNHLVRRLAPAGA